MAVVKFRAGQTVKRVLPLSIFALAICGLLLAQSGVAQSSFVSHTKVGDRIPAISVHEISGPEFSTTHERGKVVLVNFWATWCGPCQLEMPRLEKEIWDKYKSNPNFAMVAIAREQTKDVVSKFQQIHPYTFPLACDPDRSAYKLFADAGIPRNYVVDRHGRIVFQSIGYDPGEFAQMEMAIQKALAEK